MKIKSNCISLPKDSVKVETINNEVVLHFQGITSNIVEQMKKELDFLPKTRLEEFSEDELLTYITDNYDLSEVEQAYQFKESFSC